MLPNTTRRYPRIETTRRIKRGWLSGTLRLVSRVQTLELGSACCTRTKKPPQAGTMIHVLDRHSGKRCTRPHNCSATITPGEGMGVGIVAMMPRRPGPILQLPEQTAVLNRTHQIRATLPNSAAILSPLNGIAAAIGQPVRLLFVNSNRASPVNIEFEIWRPVLPIRQPELLAKHRPRRLGFDVTRVAEAQSGYPCYVRELPSYPTVR